MLSVSEKAERALRIVKEAKEFAYDTETSGVDWKRNFPIGYVVTDESNESYYVPVRHGGGGNLSDPNVRTPQNADDDYVQHKFEKALADAMASRRGKLIGHNTIFDMHMSANVGIMLGRNVECTQNNEALIDEFTRSFSLENIAKTYGVAAKKGDTMYEHLAKTFQIPCDKKSMAYYWRLPGDDEIAVEYAEGDGITTFQLWKEQMKQIEQQELNVVHQLESKLIYSIFRVERRGIKIDIGKLEEVIAKTKQYADEALQALPSNFNPRSPKDVRELCEQAGRTDWPTTEKGNPSFTEKFLSGFEQGEKVVNLRKWTNLYNSFAKPLLEEHVYNGRVHATLNQVKTDDYGTISGRFSCSRPNLQQVPKRDKAAAKLFRQVFIPDEGMEFYDVDYSQCEPRLFAHYSGEPALVNGYNAVPPRDMHQVVADMLAVERDPTAKRMNMGILTGMFPKSFAGHMGWGLVEATDAWNRWFVAFPGIKDFQLKAKNVLKSRGYVKTILGRRCRLDQPRFAYKAVSKIIQGSNADILKWYFLILDQMLEELGDPAHILMNIHDAFQWQAPADAMGEALARDMVRKMVTVQEAPFNLRVPFAVDVGKGSNWAEATFG